METEKEIEESVINGIVSSDARLCINCKDWKKQFCDIGLCKEIPFNFTLAWESCSEFEKVSSTA